LGQVQWFIPVIPDTQEVEIRRIIPETITNTKKDWIVVQIVEYLPSKHKALSSNPHRMN
jgi:hypothetical protein